MKRIILMLITILLLGAFSCNTNSSDPKGVLMSFMNALGKKDINEAKKYATKDSEAMLGMIQMGMSMAPDSVKNNKIYDKNNMEFGEAVISGDKATLPVKDKKSGETINYTLKKESGAWKVAFDKSTMMDMGKEKMKEHGMDSTSSKMLDNLKSMQNNNNNQTMPDSSHQ